MMKHGCTADPKASVPVDSGLAVRWSALVDEVNGRRYFGAPGVRDPEFPCDEYDGKGYDGNGHCMSDGHYECANCSHLSPEATR